MQVARTLAVALAAQRLTETVKEALPVIPPPIAKSTFVLALSTGITFLFEKDAKKALLEAAAAAGAASLLHDLQDAARRYTDNQITQVLQRQPRRTAPLGGG